MIQENLENILAQAKRFAWYGVLIAAAACNGSGTGGSGNPNPNYNPNTPTNTAPNTPTTPKNNAPVINTASLPDATQDKLYQTTILAADADNDPLAYELTQKPTWLNIDQKTGQLSGTPRNADVGTTNLEVRVSDGKTSVTKQYQLNIANINDAPVVQTITTLNAVQNQQFQYQINATDPDNDPLTYQVISPLWLSIDNTGKLTAIPTNANVGTHNLELRISDGIVTITKTSTINVADVNDAPVINTASLPAATQDQAYIANISATDPDNNPLTYEIVNSLLWLSIDSKTGQLSGTPGNQDVKPTTLEVRVSDGQLAVTKQYSLNIVNVNDAPDVQNIPALNALLGQAFEYQIIASDPDNDPLTYQVVSPSWLSVDNTGKLTGTPSAALGQHNLEVMISDGIATVTKTSTINVARPNSPPVIQTISLPDVMQGSYYQVKISATDPDLDTLTYSLTVSPGWLGIQSGLGNIIGTPTNADVGLNNVEITVTDGKAITSKSFTINVINTNDAPEINSLSLPDAVSNQLYQAVIDATDIDNDVLTYKLLVHPSWLDITPNTGLISGTPTQENRGDNKLIVIVTDGKESRAKELSINVYTNAQPAYSVSLPPNGFLGEYRCHSNDHHFLTIINHVAEFAIRSHPGKDINGWGTTLYLMPFFPSGVLTGATLDSIVYDSTGVSVNASGVVAQGSSSSYGTWTASMRFDYAAAEKKVTGTGDYTITLADSVSSLNKGDLNLLKIATNYLHQVPRLSLSGSIGDTGDMENVDVIGDNFNFTWDPVQQPAHFPQDITDTMSIDVHGEYNDVDTVTMGRARIEPAYKPNVKVVLHSKIPGQRMIYGAIYDTSKATLFWEDNIGITPLILSSSTAQNFEYRIDFESTALPGDK